MNPAILLKDTNFPTETHTDAPCRQEDQGVNFPPGPREKARGGTVGGILVQGVSKSFGKVEAVRGVDLHVEEGEFLVLLGPSGSGKTTTLRCIAGLEDPTTGEIFLRDRCVFSERGVNVPPRERRVGFAFQSVALYPHMNVYKNVAFALAMKGVRGLPLEQRVKEALRLAELEGFENRRPWQLSGGQQQRVAVARIFASRPEALLFDEPLSNLDPMLRVSLRTTLKALHRQTGATSIYVTHDPSEAMLLADRIAVMVKGEIAQIDSAERVYHFPATPAVAETTADTNTNLLEGELHRTEDRLLLIPKLDPYCFIRLGDECRGLAGQQVVFHVRPEDVQVVAHPEEDEGRLQVLAVMPRGTDTLVHLRLGEHMGQVVARAPDAETQKLRPGQQVSLRFLRGNIYSAESRQIVQSFGGGEAVSA
jgi:multiple sugar transport system ATP-binding protein